MCHSCTKSYWKILIINIVLVLFGLSLGLTFENRRESKVLAFRSLPTSPLKLQLGQECTRNSDCTQMNFAHCHDGVCSCYPYHIRYNSTLCLPASLLGFGCLDDEQCRMKVPNSKCVDGVCSCESGFIQLRKDKCLAGAKIGQLCASDEQCRLSSHHSHCKYIIPRVYGRCVCDDGLTADKEDRCVPLIGSRCWDNTFCRSSIRHSRCGHHSVAPQAFRSHLFSTQSAGPTFEDSFSGRSWRSADSFPIFSQRIHLHRKIRPGISNTSTSLPKALRGLVHGPHHKHCLCEKGFRVSDDRKRCLTFARGISEVPVSLGKPCQTSDQCQLRDPNSDCIGNVCQCVRPDPNCNANNTGCHKDTFQCQNGQCISWFFVCNGLYNCDDGSDEQECIQWKCPKEAFQCLNGDCISRAKLCNGKMDCLDGSDELNCYGSCDTTKVLRCSDGACLPQYMFCNAVSSCRDMSDEDPATCELGIHCPKEHFRCGNGRCRSTATLCSGKDGCGDNSDETRCRVCDCPKSR